MQWLDQPGFRNKGKRSQYPGQSFHSSARRLDTPKAVELDWCFDFSRMLHATTALRLSCPV